MAADLVETCILRIDNQTSLTKYMGDEAKNGKLQRA